MENQHEITRDEGLSELVEERLSTQNPSVYATGAATEWLEHRVERTLEAVEHRLLTELDQHINQIIEQRLQSLEQKIQQRFEQRFEQRFRERLENSLSTASTGSREMLFDDRLQSSTIGVPNVATAQIEHNSQTFVSFEHESRLMDQQLSTNSEGSTAPTVHRLGLTELSTPEGVDGVPYRVNVIFIHGLRGHPKRTWQAGQEPNNEMCAALETRRSFRSIFRSRSETPTTAENSGNEGRAFCGLFWPCEFLTHDIPEARVWTYGYNADMTGGLFEANGQNSISQHGRDFSVQMERDITNKDPMIFIAHSLGGIVVKDVMHRSEECRSRTKLILFLGTPHRGSSYAEWGKIIANLTRLVFRDSNKTVVKTLQVNAEVLDNIHDEFISVVFQYGIKIHSFQESRGILGMKGLQNKVVSDFSSKLGLPKEYETAETIDANHMQMARCRSRSDAQYRAIVSVLKQFLRGNT